MIKTTLLSLTTALALATIGHASVVTLSGTRTGPTVVTSGGSLVTDGLVRLGAFLGGLPAGPSVAEIDAAFTEFGTGDTGAAGRLGQTFNNGDAGAFNGANVYIWAFNGADVASSSQHGVFGLASPAAGDWEYPVHTGAGADSVTLPLSDLLAADAGDTTITPGVVYDLANGQFALIPEPSGAVLAGLAGALLVFRRRR